MVDELAVAINAFVERMLTVTVQLVGDVQRFPNVSGRGSGLLLPRGHDFLLLTAGHLFKPGTSWSLETAIKTSEGCLHVALRDLQLLTSIDLKIGTEESIDLAWAWIRQADIQKALRDPRVTEAHVDFPVYQGPLDVQANDEELFGFAAYSRAAFDPNDDALVREPVFEVGLSLKSRDQSTGILIFNLPHKHKGHAYYKGASGAPIADSAGHVIGLLLSGDSETNTLSGIELARFRSLFDIAALQAHAAGGRFSSKET